MESDESDKCSSQAGNSEHLVNSSHDMSAPNEEQTRQIHERRNDKAGVKYETDNERNFCNNESDTNSETNESSDDEESDTLSETFNETDHELADDDNGNDENGNIKELNDERDVEDDWESMEEDDDDEDVNDKEGNNLDAGMDSDSSNDHSERCPVCLNRFIGQVIGTPESCDHCFCLECLLEWSKNINTCPVDRKVYNRILSRNELGGSVIEKIPIKAPVTEVEPNDDDDDDDVTYCEVCGECDREDTLLLCDFCDEGYHCECLTPPLDHVPIVEWYCPRCIIAGNVEANTEGNDVMSSHASRLHRVIARTRASESVRHRIQQRRITNRGTRSRSNPVRKRRKVRRRKRTTKKSKTRRSTKTQLSRIKQKANKRSSLKPRRGRRKLRRRKRKTRRAVATARPLIAPTIRKRIADKIGMVPPRAGQTLPQMKRHCLPRSLNVQRYDGGVPTVSLFGHRHELDVVDEDYENNTGGVATVHPAVTSHGAVVAHYARLTSKQALTLERRIMSATPLLARENIDILGDIIEEQKILYKKSQDISIQRNGLLKVKSPNDGLEQKQETESSDERGKIMHENPEKEESSKDNDLKDTIQSTSSNMSSNVDMFDSDNNDNNATNTDLPHGAHRMASKENKENKSRKQRRNILNYNAMQLYSDVEEDEENEALWCPPKKKRSTSVDKNIDIDEPIQEDSMLDQNRDVEKLSSSKSKKTDGKLHEAADSAMNVPDECDKEQGSLRTDSDSGILQRVLEEREQNISELMPEEYDNSYKKKGTSGEKEKKEDSGEETADDFTDIAPRVNIAVLPKIPKIKRERDEKQEEEVNSESGRHSVLSKVDEGSQETRWNKLSRFSRDKNSSDNKSERSFSDHGPRSKHENFRWSNDRNNRDNRHWRERDDGDDFRDRRHGGRQREHDRWEKPWKSDQRNRFDSYNYGNDNRKKFSRDNRSGTFRDRKDFPRGKPGNMKEYSRDKDRNVGGKNNSGERDGIYRDIPNRNFKKFSYDASEIRKGPMNQSAKFEVMDREIECGITTIENEAMNSKQCVNDLMTNSPLAQSVEWGGKQNMADVEARENFWKMQDEGRHQSVQCDNADGNANRSGSCYRKLRSPSPPSPPENESYDPFDPTESPVHKSSTNQTEPPLDIPLPDRNDGSQIMKSLDNIEDKPMMSQPPPRFSQPSFDQSTTCGFVPRGTLPNVHIPPPNFVMPSVPRPPFSNIPNVQPFNWSTPPPPPALLVPPMMRGNFLPPPLPPRMITPQPQIGCLPPTGPPPGPPPGPIPVMTPRGMQGSGPFVPNLPPPPMQNIPPQVTLTNIAHPPPPPPPPPPSHMITNSVQNSAPPIIPSHAPPRPLFIPPTTSSSNPLQDTSLPPASNQATTVLHSPLPISSTASVQNTDISNTVSAATVPITTTAVQPSSKKNDGIIPTNTATTTSEFPKNPTDIETTNQSTAPSDVTDIVDMEVDSPFSPTNSPIDFDDVSIASSSEKSTPSPIGREVILSSPRPKFLASKHALEVGCSTPLKAGSKPSNDLSITENSKSSKIISCGQSLLEEVWAKHILSDSSSKGSYLDVKKKPIEKIRVVRDVSAKEALKLEGSSFKMDEDQLKILDEIPSSAVEMQVKEKYMKKLNRQERVIEEVKLALKPYYNRRDIDKEEYKEILRKCVPKICHNRSGSIIPKKVKILVEAYVEKFSYHRKKGKDRPFPNT